jgi:hypothetical protein
MAIPENKPIKKVGLADFKKPRRSEAEKSAPARRRLSPQHRSLSAGPPQGKAARGEAATRTHPH